MKDVKDLVASKEQIKELIPRVGKQALKQLQTLQLSIREMEIVRDVLKEYPVTALTVAHFLEAGLSASEATDLIVFETNYGGSALVSHAQATRTFLLCGRDLAVMDTFLNLANPYLDAVSGRAASARRYSFLLHLAETKFGGDIGPICKILGDYDVEQAHLIFTDKRLPKDPNVEEFLNQVFEGGNDDDPDWENDSGFERVGK